MMNMGSGSQILHLILIIIFFFNAHFLIAGLSMNAAEYSDDPGLQEQYLIEYNVDGKENQIQKVSGEDESEEKRAPVFEKFRFLLGLKSFNIRSPTNGHAEHGFLSPSPAPGIEAEAEAPAPVTVAHTHVHSHPPLPRSSPAPLPHDVRREHRDKARIRRIVVAVAVSGGVASVFSALGLILLCRKCLRGRRKRSTKTMLVSETNGGNRRSKYRNSTNGANKVSFDLGPEHFYLNSLQPVSEPDTSCLKPTCETVKISSEQNQTKSPLDGDSESGRESMKSQSENVSCSSVEEITSVNELEEAIKCEPHGSNSMANKPVPVESLPSDDESFHSFCDSYSSNFRISNASEGDYLSDQSDIFSPPSYPMRSSPPDHSSTSPTLSSSMKSPTPPMTPDLTPPLHSNLQSSPSCPCNPKQMTPTSQSSPIYQHFPPPPPPPLPRVHVSPSQSSSSPKRIAPTTSCSTMPNASSPQNSDSSSGSNQMPPNEYPYSPHHKLQQASSSPPGDASIPLPPCPPLPPLRPSPFTKGCSNSLQPPPPPPGQLPQFIPLGKDGAPLPKLKPLHWDKVRAAPDRSMVWDKLRSSSFELDEKMIESLFGYNLQIKNDDTKSKSPSPSKHVLEPKRLQNITILSKALNATPEQVGEALIQGNGLCLQQLEALVKMIPTKEEEAKLSSYQGDVNELGSAEKFVKAMLNVPFAFQRIEAMLYKETFEDEVVHLRKSFAMLEEACKELRSSRLFLKVLEAVLKTGNRMNVGTIRGGAIAFKLDALLKLADVKGTDGKTTLLHFVVQEMIRSEGIRDLEVTIENSNQKTKGKTVEEMEEDYRTMGLDLVSGLSTEFCNVKKTATIDLDVLASSVSNLSDGMIKLKRLVHEDFFMDNQYGNFVHLMRTFLNYAEKNINGLQKDEDRVLLRVREITEYFHGDVSKDEANPLWIFVIVRDFLGMLDQVCKEVRTMKMPNIPNSTTPFR